MTQRFGAAVSEHPVAAHAVGEAVGQVLDAVGEAPQLAVLFVTGQSSDALDDICQTVQATLRPEILIGVAGVGVLCNQREVEHAAAISLWAGRVDGCVPVRLAARSDSDGGSTPLDLPAATGDGTLILLADPFSFPLETFLEELREVGSELVVVGGLASASSLPDGNRLLLDRTIHTSGAVGVWVPPGAVGALVSQGCRPVGSPLTVTRTEQNLLSELGGRPALDHVREIAVAEGDDDALQKGLYLGVVVNEQQLDFWRGDFLIRGVRMDPATGGVVVTDPVEVGQTVQFQVRDAATADEDLRQLLENRVAASALVFAGASRGSRLFHVADHDAAMVYEALGGVPVAGVFCDGELGPIGRENHLHTFTASVALFS